MASRTNIALVLNQPQVSASSSPSPSAEGSCSPSPGATPPPAGEETSMLSIDISLGFYPHDGSEPGAATPAIAGGGDGGGVENSGAARPEGKKEEVEVEKKTLGAATFTVFKKAMSRPKTESLQKTVERIRLNMEKKGTRQKKSKMSREDLLANLPTLTVLDAEGNAIDMNLPNDEAWSQAKSLSIGTKAEIVIPVIYNAPTVLTVKPPTSIVMGVPCMSSGVTVLFHNQEDLLYEWRVRKSDAGAPTPPPAGAKKKKGGGGGDEEVVGPKYPEEDYVLISTRAVFTPQESEELSAKLDGGKLQGKTVYCRVRPNAPDSFWTEVECPRVTPSVAGVDQSRWLLTPNRLKGDHFRVVSYNILHDAFCTSNYAKSTLYPFCPPQFLDLNFRKGRILQELSNYNSDIFCFQECGKEIYTKYYKGVLSAQGYDSVFTVKTGNVTEGLATGFDRSKYSLVEHHWFPLSYRYFDGFNSVDNGKKFSETRSITNTGNQVDYLSVENVFTSMLSENAELKELQEAIKAHPHLEEGLKKVTSVGSATVLREKNHQNESNTTKKEERIVIVSNCHLFWHPNGCHIRTIQCYLHMMALELLRKRLQGQLPEAVVATICCGDYNCGRKFKEEFAPGAPGTPTGGYEIMRTSAVRPVNRAWQKGMKFWWGGEEEAEAAAEATADQEEGGEEGAATASGVSEKKAETSAGNPATTVGAYTKHGPPTSVFQGDLKLPSFKEGAATYDEKGELTKTSEAAYYLDTHLKDPNIQWTNFSLGFKAVIDHIFVSQSVLSCTRTIPLPSEAEVTVSTCIPSDVFPSDHLALIADLQWKKE